MEFEWDETKREINIEKHGIDFLDVLELFNQKPRVKKSSYLEENRFLATGTVMNRNITVVYTMTKR
jgi:uncharacterized protein